MEFRKTIQGISFFRITYGKSGISIGSRDNYLRNYKDTFLSLLLPYIDFFIYRETNKNKFCKDFSDFQRYKICPFFWGARTLNETPKHFATTTVALRRVIFLKG